MPTLTQVKYTNPKIGKTLKIVGIVLAALILVTVGIYVLHRSGLLAKKEDTDARSYTMTPEMSQITMESDLHTGYLFSRTQKILQEDRGTDPWVVNWYVIPGTTRTVPAMQSGYVDAFDQVLLLETYVSEGSRSKADSLMKAIDDELCCEDGTLRAFIRLPKRDQVEYADGSIYENDVFEQLDQAPVSMKATNRYLRALLNYYDRWGGKKVLNRIKDLAAIVFGSESSTSYKAADRIAAPTPIPVTEKSLVPEVTEEETNPSGVVSQTGVELSSLDLEALRRTAVLLPEYQEKYEALVQIVKGGKISENLPLYAWMYLDEENYTYYAGSEMSVELVPSLYTMVYLAEIGEMDQSSYAWVSGQIYNSGYLFTSYDLISGEATTETEALEAYPLVMYLAMIKGDEELFEATFSAMMRNYATLDTSEALYMYFREVENGRIAVYARENLLAEIYIR